MGDAGGGGFEAEHSLDGVGLLHRRELFSLAVLGDHGLELLQRVEVKHKTRHGSGAGLLARGEPAMAGDDTITLAVGHDGERREEPVGLDAGR